MGILKELADFIAALKLPTGFSVCELGNQEMSGVEASAASAFYSGLGCGRYVSIDANGLGTLTADLNLPLTSQSVRISQSDQTAPIGGLIGRFDLVTDFGTGEHIFDQAQVWRTLHELTRPGGYIAFDRPCQGYGKHCFYLTTQGLYEDIALANRYATVQLKQCKMPRGRLIRGVFRRRANSEPFQYPQQGRYQASLRLPVKVVA